MRSRSALCTVFALPLLAIFAACGSEAPGSAFANDQGENGGQSAGGFDPSGKPCEGLGCKQVDCGTPGVTTTLSGFVTAPNGTLPLYNVMVFVPNADLEPLTDGATCDRCGTVSGKPLVSTLSGPDGKFELKDVPVGADIPLVVQIGKWRRKVTLPKIEQCVDNAVDIGFTRLPKNSAEGDIPRIAVTTGRCDQLACLLPKLGLDASEFSASTGAGKLHVYRGSAHPAAAPIPAPAPFGSVDAATLWADTTAMKKYDILMMSCECGEHEETKPLASKQALYDYSTAGGRVFASHFHYSWAEVGPLATTAKWMGSPNNPENPPGPYLVDQSFPKGDAFAKWLVGTGASSVEGQIPISQPRENVGSVVSPTQRWVYRNGGDPTTPQPTKYLTVNTPVGAPADQICGKFVYADMHLYGGDVQDPTTALPDDNFPSSCSTSLTPEEKALAFLFFDLAACIQDDTKPPVPPIR